MTSYEAMGFFRSISDRPVEVEARLKEDFLSYPRIATMVRKWARMNTTVCAVELYTTPEAYGVSVLLGLGVLPERQTIIQKEIRELLQAELWPQTVEQVHVDTPLHAVSSFFGKKGSVRIVNEEIPGGFLQ